MKKQLLTSTALVAAGVLAVSGPALAQSKSPTLSVGGYSVQAIGWADNNDTNENGTTNGNTRVEFDTNTDYEIFFTGSVTLENGIRIRTQVQLEGDQNADQIDETWMRVGNADLGELRMGAADMGGKSATSGFIGDRSTNVSEVAAFDLGQWLQTPATVSGSVNGEMDLSGDGDQISYVKTFAPVGLTIGVGYAPSAQQDNGTRTLKNAADHDIWSLGANYVGKFGNAGVGIAAGYSFAKEDTDNKTDDPEAWIIGAYVDFSGFRLGVSKTEVDQQDTTATGLTAVAGREVFSIGGRYTFGPNQVQLAYIESEAQADGTNAANGDEISVLKLAYQRALGPGVFWQIHAYSADFDDALNGAAAANSNDGEAVVMGLRVHF